MQLNRKSRKSGKIKSHSTKSNKATDKINIPCDLSPDSSVPTDTLGSYTGSPEDGGKPVQDADDL